MSLLKGTYADCRPRPLAAVLCALVCACALLPTAVTGQAQQPGQQTVEELISQLQRGQFDAATLHSLARARAVQAIPGMKQQFDAKQDVVMKMALASALVRLGEKTPVYWDYLVKYATSAVGNDAPFPTPFDSQGKVVREHLAPEFLQWAKAHNTDPNTAAETQIYVLPAYLGFLAMTGETRGLAVLRKGLSSPNYMVQAMAAKGLAKLQDIDSVPRIIEVCAKAPSDVAPLIARSLVFFNTPQASSAAERFIPDREVLEELRKLNREKGIDALF